jgi:peptide/nickel transport system permease protein
MSWWERLKENSLARWGGAILATLYAIALFAEFVAPYEPYEPQPDGALLPPTAIHWNNPSGAFGPFVYPTTQGAIDTNTGLRALKIDQSAPSPIKFFVQGFEYKLFGLIPSKLHLFGAEGRGRINILGTDEQARDQWSRLVYGSRVSLFIGLLGIGISFPLGLLAGGVAGYFGGWVDGLLMRFVEVLMTVPDIYLLIALSAVLPTNLNSAQRFFLVTMIISFVRWAGLARVIRGQVLSIKEREFIQAAKVMGGKPLYIILRHVLPQTATYVIITATLTIPSFIIAEAILSLIGLGIQQPDPSWGNMLSLATNASILVLQPWLVAAPAMLMALTVLAFNLLGDGLRDVLDPRSVER